MIVAFRAIAFVQTKSLFKVIGFIFVTSKSQIYVTVPVSCYYPTKVKCRPLLNMKNSYISNIRNSFFFTSKGKMLADKAFFSTQSKALLSHSAYPSTYLEAYFQVFATLFLVPFKIERDSLDNSVVYVTSMKKPGKVRSLLKTTIKHNNIKLIACNS